MATHEQNIEALRTAVYGEQVRGSMIELFNEDYAYATKALSTGTAVNSENSSTVGFLTGNLYYNTSLYSLWKCTGSKWQLLGILKGEDGERGKSLTATSNKTGKTTIVQIKDPETGEVVDSFNILDGADGTGSGDMNTSVYDTNRDGIVDQAQALTGEDGSTMTKADIEALIGDVESLLASL